jgi:hypothetical protein
VNNSSVPASRLPTNRFQRRVRGESQTERLRPGPAIWLAVWPRPGMGAHLGAHRAPGVLAAAHLCFRLLRLTCVGGGFDEVGGVGVTPLISEGHWFEPSCAHSEVTVLFAHWTIPRTLCVAAIYTSWQRVVARHWREYAPLSTVREFQPPPTGFDPRLTWHLPGRASMPMSRSSNGPACPPGEDR